MASPDSADNYTSILSSIERHKTYEAVLQTQLLALSIQSPAATTAEVTALNTLITDAAAIRVTLYQALANTYNSTQDQVNNAALSLTDQLTVKGVVEHELEQAKKQTNSLVDSRNNMQRMTAINSYAGKRYKALASVMKLIILFCIPLLVLAALKSYNLLGDDMHKFFTGLTLALAIFIVGRRLWDIYVRSDMNFDEYNWSVDDPDALHPTVYEYNKAHVFDLDVGLGKLINLLGIDCFGAACCAKGTVYDTGAQTCKKEGFQMFELAKPREKGITAYCATDGQFAPVHQ